MSKKKKPNSVLAAHIGEQMDAECLHFMKALEHHKLEGCLYFTDIDNKEKIFVFSPRKSIDNFANILTACGKMASGKKKIDIDKI
jgi:hypothetical protein